MTRRWFLTLLLAIPFLRPPTKGCLGCGHRVAAFMNGQWIALERSWGVVLANHDLQVWCQTCGRQFDEHPPVQFELTHATVRP